MRFILLYVEFEDGVSISVFKNGATRHKKSKLVSKKVKTIQRPPAHFDFTLPRKCVAIALTHRRMPEHPSRLE
jgi:hypothetical protein